MSQSRVCIQTSRLLLAALCLSAWARAENSGVEAVKRFAEATRRGDTKAMAELMHPDYFEVSPAGEVDSREKVLGFYAPAVFNASQSPKSVTVEDAHVVEAAGATIVTTRDTFEIETPGGLVKRSLRTTSVLVSSGGRLTILSRQYTGIRPKP